MADVFTDNPQEVTMETQPFDTEMSGAAEDGADFTDTVADVVQEEALEIPVATLTPEPTVIPEESDSEPDLIELLNLIHETLLEGNQISTNCFEQLTVTDSKISILSDFLMQNLTEEETETLLSSGEDVTMMSVQEETETVPEAETTETEAVPEETDIYIEKLETLIELQKVTNDNLVMAYNNLNRSIFVLILVVSFVAGAVILSNLFSKVRV